MCLPRYKYLIAVFYIRLTPFWHGALHKGMIINSYGKNFNDVNFLSTPLLTVYCTLNVYQAANIPKMHDGTHRQHDRTTECTIICRCYYMPLHSNAFFPCTDTAVTEASRFFFFFSFLPCSLGCFNMPTPTQCTATTSTSIP